MITPVSPGANVIEYHQNGLSSPSVKLIVTSGDGSVPEPWSTCPMRGSDEVVPEKFWNVATQVSVRSAVRSLLLVPVMRVLLSEPKLSDWPMKNVTALEPGLRNEF